MHRIALACTAAVKTTFNTGSCELPLPNKLSNSRRKMIALNHTSIVLEFLPKLILIHKFQCF